jgi:hypothetical protein
MFDDVYTFSFGGWRVWAVRAKGFLVVNVGGETLVLWCGIDRDGDVLRSRSLAVEARSYGCVE